VERFLALHDYGMGGTWIWIRAESAVAIRHRYPDLVIVDDPPPDLGVVETADLDDDDHWFLSRLARGDSN
jgi:hypothetical protein